MIERASKSDVHVVVNSLPVVSRLRQLRRSCGVVTSSDPPPPTIYFPRFRPTTRCHQVPGKRPWRKTAVLEDPKPAMRP